MPQDLFKEKGGQPIDLFSDESPQDAPLDLFSDTVAKSEPSELPLWKRGVEFLTGGHVTFDPEKLYPEPEVVRSPTGEVIEINEPETASVGFFEDPVTAVTAGAVGGMRYAAKPLGKLAYAGREALGWMTGGASEAPAIAKAGAKATGKIVEGASAKQMEKTMAGAAKTAERGLGVKPPVKEGIATGSGSGAGRLVSPDELDPHKLIEQRIGKKYKDILNVESNPVGEIFEKIDDKALKPEELDSFLSGLDGPEKMQAIDDVKSTIADQIGEIIETHKYEGRQGGHSLEAYLDRLLEVTERHSKTLPGKGMRDSYPTSGLEAGEGGRVSDTRGGMKSEGKESLDLFDKEGKPGQGSEFTKTLKAKIEGLEEGQHMKGLKAKVKKTAEGFSEALHSPGKVYNRDPETGTKIYRLIDRADQQKNSFLATEGEELVKAAGKIKERSLSSVRVGQALDGKLGPDNLQPDEQRLYEFMKEKYDFLLQKWARTAAGSEEGYLKALRAANKEKPPYVKVQELPKEKQTNYNTLKSELAKIRKGRSLEELDKQESKHYWAIRKEMRGILEDQWKGTLKPGEREAYDVLKEKVKDYLPHIFDKDILIDAFKNELADTQRKLATATNKAAITQFKERLRMLQEAIVNLEKGKLVTYESLPKYVRFRFFETRKGKAGYSFDSVKAFQTYLNGIARKIYDEPAIRQVAVLHKDLDPSLKSYNKWYVRRYMGWDKNKLDDFAGTIASFQWMRTLGLNPRSAIVNLTQRVNTIAEIGVKNSLKGEAMAFTKEGKELFDKTGIAKEIPTVLMEGTVPEGMEKARAVLGYMFNKVELGNRRHAFLSGYSKAKAAGKAEEEAIQYGVDTAHKTQFRYGKVGMPKALTNPVGRLAGQFWSYPIKQIELIVDWAKNDPAKLVKYLAMAEGGNYALNEFLGIDLSNALGFGMNYGEAIKALGDIPEGDWRGFFRHTRLTFSGGGGLLPSGLGPTASGIGKVIQKAGEGKGSEQFVKEITPVMGKRIADAYRAVKDRKSGLYPMKNSKGHIMYYLTSKELAMRTFGPRPSKESKEYAEWKRASLLEQERKEVLEDITQAIVDNDMDKANRLIDKYQVVPTRRQVDSEILKRNLSREEREAMKPFGKKGEYRAQRGENK